MSNSSHFLHKAWNNINFSNLRAVIKTIVLILVVVYSLVGMKPINASADGYNLLC